MEFNDIMNVVKRYQFITDKLYKQESLELFHQISQEQKSEQSKPLDYYTYQQVMEYFKQELKGPVGKDSSVGQALEKFTDEHLQNLLNDLEFKVLKLKTIGFSSNEITCLMELTLRKVNRILKTAIHKLKKAIYKTE
jgi:hypothetical protein